MQEFIVVAALLAGDAPAVKSVHGLWVLTDERGTWSLEADFKGDGSLKWTRRDAQESKSGGGKWEKVGANGVRAVLLDAEGGTFEEFLLPDGRKDDVKVEADDKSVVWARVGEGKAMVGHWKLEPFRKGAPPAFYEFQTDGTCVYTNPIGDSVKGRWHVSASGKLLTWTGRTQPAFKMHKQSNGSFHLEGANGAMYGLERFKPVNP